ncbi:MAG: isoprenyl transferase [Desulfobacterales bacterium]|nr:isoprenyl transferase [Desulfobacterales bacterium]
MSSKKFTQYREEYGLNIVPSHVAIIMDGNGRWAKKQMMNRIKGHEKGINIVKTIVRTSRELGISYLTLYAFSTENWERPKVEVDALMRLLKKFLMDELKELNDNEIKLNAIGQTERLPFEVLEILRYAMNTTKNNNYMTLNLALSYGGRSEILRAVKAIVDKVKNGSIAPNLINEDMISSHLYTNNMPDPDLLIRTSGEMRVSNFLLWQIAYTEFHFSQTLWPDFTKEEYIEILKNYQERERRFGKVL